MGNPFSHNKLLAKKITFSAQQTSQKSELSSFLLIIYVLVCMFFKGKNKLHFFQPFSNGWWNLANPFFASYLAAKNNLGIAPSVVIPVGVTQDL